MVPCSLLLLFILLGITFILCSMSRYFVWMYIIKTIHESVFFGLLFSLIYAMNEIGSATLNNSGLLVLFRHSSRRTRSTFFVVHKMEMLKNKLFKHKIILGIFFALYQPLSLLFKQNHFPSFGLSVICLFPWCEIDSIIFHVINWHECTMSHVIEYIIKWCLGRNCKSGYTKIGLFGAG